MAPQPPTDEEEVVYEAAESTATPHPSGQLMYEEVIYRDEYGNVIPEDEVSRLLEERGEEIEFRTIYETQTRTLQAGEEPPAGVKRVPNNPAKGEVPQYPEGQNPETKEEEKKPYRTS